MSDDILEQMAECSRERFALRAEVERLNEGWEKANSELLDTRLKHEAAVYEVELLRNVLGSLLSRMDDHSEATPIGYFARDRDAATAVLYREKKP